jgi:hypothetical protein
MLARGSASCLFILRPLADIFYFNSIISGQRPAESRHERDARDSTILSPIIFLPFRPPGTFPKLGKELRLMLWIGLSF